MLSFNDKQSFYKTKNKIDYILTIQAYRVENKIIDNETLQRLKDKETKGKLRFVSPFHYELRTEEKRQGVRNGKYRVFGKVIRNVVHPKLSKNTVIQ